MDLPESMRRKAGGETEPARPDEELLADLAEAVLLVRAFLTGGRASLDDVIQKTGFARNAAIVACKEAANENDETRKRFEVMCREVFKKFKACINTDGMVWSVCRELAVYSDRLARRRASLAHGRERGQADRDETLLVAKIFVVFSLQSSVT